jgi:mannan endo-1,4-beta-mannosidase
MCAWYFKEVDKVVDIVKELNFTIVFRPLHEMTGFWFWWGNPRQLRPEDGSYHDFAHRYKKLYRSLVAYTRLKGAHNLLYAWAPSNEVNFDFYPGDEWVDVVGLDVYEQGTEYGPSLSSFKAELRKLTSFAESHGKISILAETGFRMGYPVIEPRFWTENVLKPLTEDAGNLRVAWVLSWMNAQWERNPYIPYRGMQHQAAIEDFRQFFFAPQTLFEGDFSGIETSEFVINPLQRDASQSPLEH